MPFNDDCRDGDTPTHYRKPPKWIVCPICEGTGEVEPLHEKPICPCHLCKGERGWWAKEWS
jgi:hypothetical protein